MKTNRSTVLIAVILGLAVIAAAVVMVLTSPASPVRSAPIATPTPTPTPTSTPAPTPTPTPSPDITSIRIYAFGKEMTADGFTMYIGDKPIELTAAIEPEGLQYSVEWSFSDPEAASLEAKGDTCTITPLQASGKNELTIVCHNLYTTIPVYLWER